MSKNSFYTHDNGGRPFKVCICKSLHNAATERVSVFRQVPRAQEFPNNQEPEYATDPVLEFETNQLFIGKSNENELNPYAFYWSQKHQPYFKDFTIKAL